MDQRKKVEFLFVIFQLCDSTNFDVFLGLFKFYQQATRILLFFFFDQKMPKKRLKTPLFLKYRLHFCFKVILISNFPKYIKKSEAPSLLRTQIILYNKISISLKLEHFFNGRLKTQNKTLLFLAILSYSCTQTYKNIQ